MDINDIYLWLTSIKGISNNNIKQIESNDIDIKNLINYSDKEIYDLKNINTNIKENIVKYKSLTYLDKIKLNLEKQGINYVSIYDELYPNNLKYIYDAPKILFYKGNLSILKNNINLAMVGSRKCTHYGINCAKSISKNLSDRGINIISGLAIGIDAYSHSGCLEGEGKTIAVLGSSIDNVLPRRNIKLSQQILDNGGLILSEYHMGSNVYPSNYVHRNRIISGISDGVIVVEAAKKSGALITVEYALEHGKNVFSIPGNINSCMSEGCHKIIKEGAILIHSVEDILNEYKINYNIENSKKYDNINLDEKSIEILQLIKDNGILNIDEICDNTKMEVKYINTILNELVLKDFLIENNNQVYSLNI